MKTAYCEDCKEWFPEKGSNQEQWAWNAKHSMQGHKIVWKERKE